MKKILVINANPSKNSFSSEICKRYIKGAKEAGTEIDSIHLMDLDFNPILKSNYSEKQILEDDLLEIQKKITHAQHLLFVYPTWWGTYPTLLKGFIDRVFIPGFAFKYRENSLLWDKLLKGKSARIITTMDTPKLYYSLFYKSPGHNSLKKCILEFCGIKPVKITVFSSLKKSTIKQREKWLDTAEKIGRKLC